MEGWNLDKKVLGSTQCEINMGALIASQVPDGFLEQCLFVFASFLRVFSLKITSKISKTAPHRKYEHALKKLKRNDCFLSMTMETHSVTNSALKSFFFQCLCKDILIAYFVRYFEFILLA